MRKNKAKLVKIPEPKSNGKYDTREVLRQLKVGESIFVDSFKEKEAFRQLAWKLGVKIVTKVENKGFRVWRLT